MKWLLLFICSILFLSGCCGSEVVLRKVEVKTPGIIDTLTASKSTIEIKNNDSLIAVDIYRGIKLGEGSTKDTAAIAEFIPALKKFVLKIPERVDTVYIQDTIRIKPSDIILQGNDNSERLIWIISFTLTTIFIMIYKRYSNARKSPKQA
jgi:mRNA-degrading endonuclease HigB of HigAB toxin-antitoxin module